MIISGLFPTTFDDSFQTESAVIVFASRLSEPNHSSTFAVDASSLTDSEDTIDALFDKAQELDSSFCLFKVDTRDARWMGNYLEGNLLGTG